MPLRVALCLADRHFADIPAPARWAKAKQNGYKTVTSSCNRIPIVTAGYVQVQEW